MILDLFAGPGGWSEGLRLLGLSEVGIEWDDAACRTAKAAGHTRVRADVETLPTAPMVGKVIGLIASPPCQDFSLAGKRAGIGGEKGRLITQVVDRACTGERIALTIAERREAVRTLRSRGMHDTTIGGRLHLTARAVLRIRQELGLTAVEEAV